MDPPPHPQPPPPQPHTPQSRSLAPPASQGTNLCCWKKSNHNDANNDQQQRPHKGRRINALWLWWYAGCVLGAEIYLLYRAALRCKQYNEDRPWSVTRHGIDADGTRTDSEPNSSSERPVLELYIYIALIVISVLSIVPCSIITCVFRIGNWANDGVRLGRDIDSVHREELQAGKERGNSIASSSNESSEAPSSTASSASALQRRQKAADAASPGIWQILWRHSGPMCHGFHIVAAFALLLPEVLLQAQEVKYGFANPEEIWSSELDVIFGKNLLEDGVLVFTNPDNASLPTPVPSPLPDVVHVTHQVTMSASPEMLNYLFALIIFGVRYSAVFWYTSTPFSFLFSLAQLLAILHFVFQYCAAGILYKFAVNLDAVPGLEMILSPAAVMALYLVSAALVYFSSIAVFRYGFLQYQDSYRVYLMQHYPSLGRKVAAVPTSCQGYAPHIIAMVCLLSALGCWCPLVYDLVVVYQKTGFGVVLTCIVVNAVYLVGWVCVLLIFTIKQSWDFKLSLDLSEFARPSVYMIQQNGHQPPMNGQEEVTVLRQNGMNHQQQQELRERQEQRNQRGQHNQSLDNGHGRDRPQQPPSRINAHRHPEEHIPQGHGQNQGHPQDHPLQQGHPSHGHPSQSHPSQGHPSQGQNQGRLPPPQHSPPPVPDPTDDITVSIPEDSTDQPDGTEVDDFEAPQGAFGGGGPSHSPTGVLRKSGGRRNNPVQQRVKFNDNINDDGGIDGGEKVKRRVKKEPKEDAEQRSPTPENTLTRNYRSSLRDKCGEYYQHPANPQLPPAAQSSPLMRNRPLSDSFSRADDYMLAPLKINTNTGRNNDEPVYPEPQRKRRVPSKPLRQNSDNVNGRPPIKPARKPREEQSDPYNAYADLPPLGPGDFPFKLRSNKSRGSNRKSSESSRHSYPPPISPKPQLGPRQSNPEEEDDISELSEFTYPPKFEHGPPKLQYIHKPSLSVDSAHGSSNSGSVSHHDSSLILNPAAYNKNNNIYGPSSRNESTPPPSLLKTNLNSKPTPHPNGRVNVGGQRNLNRELKFVSKPELTHRDSALPSSNETSSNDSEDMLCSQV